MTTLLVIVLITVLIVAALRLWLTANRLDRLHVRTQAAWFALEGALSRRVVATRAVAAAGGLDQPQADELRRLADAADRADLPHRAYAENDLSRALSLLPPDVEPELAAELADAGERVVLARRFYNDAVRDARALRAVWFTRVFGLAGRAALPEYFEIAEFPTPQPAVRAALTRTAARVIVLDDADRVLLLSGADPTMTPPGGAVRWWITPGGGLEPGEDLLAAAIRELAEETGFHLVADDLLGPFWRRVAKFQFTGVDYEQTEYYFATRLPRAHRPAPVADPGTDHLKSDADRTKPDADHAPNGADASGDTLVVQGLIDPELDISGHTDLERRTLTGHRWWSAAALAETAEQIYPVELPRRLPEVAAALRNRVVPDSVLDVN